MNRRHAGLFSAITVGVVMAALTSATLGQTPLPREKEATVARNMILTNTNSALAALVQANPGRGDGSRPVRGYVDVVRPDFLQIDGSGKVIGRAKEGWKNWAEVVPLKTLAPIPGEPMNLLEAAATITQLQMLSPNDALVTDEERFHWIGATRRVIETRHDNGSVSVTPNTEQRYITQVSRRHWTRGKDGAWKIQSSCIVSIQQASTL